MYEIHLTRYQTTIIALCAAVALSLSTSACVFDNTATQACADGFRCPTGMRCALNQDICIVGSCGDGVIDRNVGEVCDDGNVRPGDGCASDCRSLERCGDGNLDQNEACDDGNKVSGDGCNSTCTSDESCGNGIRDDFEECDDGNKVNDDGCSTECKLDRCGDGKYNSGEVCDDGNSISGDGCSADCLSTELCRNEYTDFNEECDEGSDHPTCDEDCTFPLCGDGYVNPMFQTEHGNLEECDDGDEGTARDTETCDIDCSLPRCGDGHHNPEYIVTISDGDDPPQGGKDNEYPEECDDGNESNDDACVDRCKAARCGDSHVQVGVETCDDGNDDTSDDCPSGPNGTCEPARCGDGHKKSGSSEEGGEDCDDGNENNNDDCPDGPDGTCQEAVCGDGHVYSETDDDSKIEECDEGPNNSNDPNADCRPTCRRPSCGDGIIDDELGEVCENNNDCESGLQCAANCLACVAPVSFH